MAPYYKHLIFCITIILTTIIHKTYSQTVWIDIDTGKVLGVSQSGSISNQQQQHPQQNYQQFPKHNNNGNGNYNYGQRHSPQPGGNYIRENERFGKNINSDWVCRQDKTGDRMIITEGVMIAKFPEQLQPNYNNRQQQQEYNQNPWLNSQNNNNNHNQQPQTTNQPGWKNENNPINNYNPTTIVQELITTPRPIEQKTLPPTILTTKSPFPVLDNIDWTKYIDTTTPKSLPPSINQAIDGEGIIIPRSGAAA